MDVEAFAAETVSVVVPTRNVARTLEACLRSIRSQDYRPIELIVVDNSSTDDTVTIARAHADTVLIAGPERSAQRNLGVEVASGPWVLWIDADMVLPPNVVSSAVAAAKDAHAPAACIPERTIGSGFWTACRTLERSCYLDDPTLANPRLVRRELLQSLGGFDERIAGLEDTDLRLRLAQDAVPVAHATAVIDHDEGKLLLRDVLRKRAYYGSSLPTFAARNPGAVRAQARGTIRAFVRHRRRLATDPLHGIGLVVLRSLEGGGYAYGAARAALTRR